LHWRLLNERRLAEAEVCLKKAIELAPNDFVANKNLGYLYLTIRHEKEAVDPLRAASEADSEDTATLAFLGEALYQTGDFAQASVPLEKALQLGPAFFRVS